MTSLRTTVLVSYLPGNILILGDFVKEGEKNNSKAPSIPHLSPPTHKWSGQCSPWGGGQFFLFYVVKASVICLVSGWGRFGLFAGWVGVDSIAIRLEIKKQCSFVLFFCSGIKVNEDVDNCWFEKDDIITFCWVTTKLGSRSNYQLHINALHL